MEALKESQRRKHEEAKREAEQNGTALPSPSFQAPDLNGARQTVQSVGSKAGAYIGSWGAWMGEKRKAGWGVGRSTSSSGMQKGKENSPSPLPIPYRNEKSAAVINPIDKVDERPKTQESFEESIFDAESNHAHSHSVEVKKADVVSPTLHPSKFHEEMEEEKPKAATPNPILAEELKKWEETIPKKPDAAERSSAVAEAVEDATATPISP
jgi:hypothetical protein